MGLALALWLAGCATLTLSEEQRLGEAMSREARDEFNFLRDRVVNAYVQDIANDILRAAGPQPFTYRFYVIEDENINAFAMPAGYIYIHTQTILEARNVSELAGVIAHEIGHVAKRHIAQNYNKQRAAGLGHQILVLGAGVLGGQNAAGAANLGGQLLGMTVLNTFTREAEVEADAFAVSVLPRAGFDPNGLVTFFETIQAQGGPHVPEFLSSHPATEDRIAATSAAIASLPVNPDLVVEDRGKLQIIQQRIRLLSGDFQRDPGPGLEPEPL